MSINWPSAPAEGATYSYGGVTYTFVSGVWMPSASPAGAVLYDRAQALAIADQATARANIGAAAFQAAQPLGAGVLQKSGANLILAPRNGNRIVINGALQTIPDGGVGLPPGGLTPNTTYPIYAYMSAPTTMALEARAAPRATQAGTGIEILAGDPTRSFIGTARTNAATAWVDTNTQRFVKSWFNRDWRGLDKQLAASSTGSTGAYVELDPASRLEFLVFAGEAVDVKVNASSYNTTGTGQMFTSVGFDGVSNETSLVAFCYATQPSDILSAAGSMMKSGLAEGYHYATVLGHVNQGTGFWTNQSGVSLGVFG